MGSADNGLYPGLHEGRREGTVAGPSRRKLAALWLCSSLVTKGMVAWISASTRAARRRRRAAKVRQIAAHDGFDHSTTAQIGRIVKA